MFLLVLSCTACSSTTWQQQRAALQAEQQDTVEKITQALALDLPKKEQASLRFERGVLFDSLGQYALAKKDFLATINSYTRLSESYNYLGLYALLDRHFLTAIAFFNQSIKYNPYYMYAYFNRGLAFYLTAQYTKAHHDFLLFYRVNKRDPYRVMWLYLNDMKRLSAKTAREKLKHRLSKLDKTSWGRDLADYYAGLIDKQGLLTHLQTYLDNERYPEFLTETYFYFAVPALDEQPHKARTLLNKAVQQQVYNFVEYRLARIFLEQLNQR